MALFHEGSRVVPTADVRKDDPRTIRQPEDPRLLFDGARPGRARLAGRRHCRQRAHRRPPEAAEDTEDTERKKQSMTSSASSAPSAFSASVPCDGRLNYPPL